MPKSEIEKCLAEVGGRLGWSIVPTILSRFDKHAD